MAIANEGQSARRWRQEMGRIAMDLASKRRALAACLVAAIASVLATVVVIAGAVEPFATTPFVATFSLGAPQP